MTTQDVSRMIHALASEMLGIPSLEDDADFFECGASSLTIVDLQAQVESKLGVTVATSSLMRGPSVQEWGGMYLAAIGSLKKHSRVDAGT